MSFTIHIDEQIHTGAVRLRLADMTPEKFWQFAQDNEGLKTEMTREGELLAYSPTGGGSGLSNNNLLFELTTWVRRTNTGFVFDSSTLFVLPNGSRRSPDASWVMANRWNSLTEEEQEKPVPFAPDFAVEILSPTDSLMETQAKMEEYRANGVRLGWLIDRKNRIVFIYRPNQDVEVLEDVATVSGEPELPGFQLDLSQIFMPRRP